MLHGDNNDHVCEQKLQSEIPRQDAASELQPGFSAPLQGAAPLTHTKSEITNKGSSGLRTHCKHFVLHPLSVLSRAVNLPSAQLDRDKWQQNCASHSINGIFKTGKKKIT